MSKNSNSSLRIGIVAGEVSGDILGARLIAAIRRKHPNVNIEGVAGPEMIAAGCRAIVPMEQLAVMGVVDVLRNLPRLLAIRRQLIRHFLANPPDVFIGVDYPDFNLSLELSLCKTGIKTVHYNSPTVWAWRQGRVKKIAKATRLMLTLFPFEASFYEQHRVPVRYVGHPLADEIELTVDRKRARLALNLSENARIIALLPGSRGSEIRYLAEDFIRTAQWLLARCPDLQFIAPMVNAKRREQFTAIVERIAPDLPLQIIEGQSRQVMAAADVILLASGTATLEAMLLKRPMVVAYRFAWLNYWIARFLIKIRSFSLPNLLAGKVLVPEFFQEAVTPEQLGTALLNYLENPEHVSQLTTEFNSAHQQLRRNASETAASAILDLVDLEA